MEKERIKGRFWSLLIDKQTINNIATGIAFSVEMCFRAAIATLVNASMGGYENGDQRQIGLIIKHNDTYNGIVSDRYDELRHTVHDLSDNDEIIEIAETHIYKLI